MTAAAPTPTIEELCARLERVTEQLVATDFAAGTQDSVLQMHRTIEMSRRRLDAVELHVINVEIEWHVPFEHGCANPTVFVAKLLGIPPAQARMRVKNAAAFGPRRGLTGEPLDPIFAICAEATRSGAITCQAARAIVTEIDKLPDDITCELGTAVEREMVAYARGVDAGEAAKFAQQLRYRLDQDGQLKDEERNQRQRQLAVRRRRDGSVLIEGEGTNELGELLQTVLDTYASPKPAADGTADPRTYAQRCHDGLRDALRDLLQSEAVPMHSGCRTTVVLHADATDFARNEGQFTTGHGYAVPMALGKTWLEPEARAILVLLTDTKGIEAYSSTHRLFTEQQRLAMQARDRGCSFVGCDRPAAWTEAHHVVEYAESERTRVDEGALVCGEDHRAFERLGWRNVMLDGVPVWIPPKWIDPAQHPRTNTRHHPPGPDLPAIDLPG